jgi:hypothetical protein
MKHPHPRIQAANVIAGRQWLELSLWLAEGYGECGSPGISDSLGFRDWASLPSMPFRGHLAFSNAMVCVHTTPPWELRLRAYQ